MPDTIFLRLDTTIMRKSLFKLLFAIARLEAVFGHGKEAIEGDEETLGKL